MFFLLLYFTQKFVAIIIIIIIFYASLCIYAFHKTLPSTLKNKLYTENIQYQ